MEYYSYFGGIDTLRTRGPGSELMLVLVNYSVT
jgi:hypothetical protein